MNTGPVAHRYAKALLKFVQERKTGEEVYSQVGVLVHVMREVRKLSEIVHKHPEIPLDRKLEILGSALGAPLAADLQHFIRLVDDHKRLEFLERIFYSFIEQYRSANSIKVGRLVTACQVSGLKERLEGELSNETGATVILEEDTDPSIVGGFILNIDDLRMDASVEGQFRQLRRELIDNNNRIV